MNCGKCDREVVQYAKFCSYCGQQVIVTCPACGVLNPPDGLFCHNCGHSLGEGKVPARPPDPSELVRPRAVTQGCPRCGVVNEPGSAYCYQCGLPLDEGMEAAYESDVARPYRVPQASTDATTTERLPEPTRPYQSPRTWASWTVGLLVVTCIAYALDMVVRFNLLSLVLQDARQFVPRGQLVDAQDNADTMGILASVAFIAAVVFFLMWIHRASRNLQSLGAYGQRFSPGWAVGWWFVPIMFFFRPYQVMAEIWRGSNAAMPQAWRGGPVSMLLPWWWALWVASILIAGIAGASDTDAVPSSAALLWALLSSALAICSGVLAILVVRRITNRQDERHRRMTAG